MEHACTPMARVLLMHLELLRRRAAAACGLLSLGLLVSYATLARSFAARWISLDQVTQGGSRGPLSLRASAESGNLKSVGGLGAILANLGFRQQKKIVALQYVDHA